MVDQGDADLLWRRAGGVLPRQGPGHSGLAAEELKVGVYGLWCGV